MICGLVGVGAPFSISVPGRSIEEQDLLQIPCGVTIGGPVTHQRRRVHTEGCKDEMVNTQPLRRDLCMSPGLPGTSLSCLPPDPREEVAREGALLCVCSCASAV